MNTNNMEYYNKYRKLEYIESTLSKLHNLLCNVNYNSDIEIKNILIDKYNKQKVIGRTPSHYIVEHICEHWYALTEDEKKKLKRLGEIYEYKTYLFYNQISDELHRIHLDTKQTKDSYEQEYVNLSKDFNSTDYLQLLLSRLEEITEIIYKFNYSTITDILEFCDYINNIEEQAYKEYYKQWDKTQGKKVREMNELVESLSKINFTAIYRLSPELQSKFYISRLHAL